MIGVSEEDYLRMVDWMVHVMDLTHLDHRVEKTGYDNQSGYDHAFYSIAEAAKEYWTPRLGYVPTDESLFRAFFAAEMRRLEREQSFSKGGIMGKLKKILQPYATKS